MKILEVTNISKNFYSTHALTDVSWDLEKGEVLALAGENGAGKSTTIKMMCGILYPTSGEVLINGINPSKKRKVVAKNIGVVFGQKTQLWWDIPLIETFKVLKEVYQVSDKDYEERMKFLNDILELDKFMDQPVRTLSLGQRMRGDLAAAMLHNPKILFLDEPTIGLDIWVKGKIRDAIKAMNKKYGTTVILTTHDMSDIADLCSRIILIEKGSIIYDGPIHNLKKEFGDLRTITIPYNDKYESITFNTFKDLVSYNKVEETLQVKFNAEKIKLEEVVNYLFKDLQASDMKIQELSLEDIVKQILERDSK